MNLASMRLDLAVPERYLAQLQLGASLGGPCGRLARTAFTGEIVAIDSGSRRVADGPGAVRFANPERLLAAGDVAAGGVALASERLPLIPMQAVEFQGGQRSSICWMTGAGRAASRGAGRGPGAA
jgi:hypothetical protein